MVWRFYGFGSWVALFALLNIIVNIGKPRNLPVYYYQLK